MALQPPIQGVVLRGHILSIQNIKLLPQLCTSLQSTWNILIHPKYQGKKMVSLSPEINFVLSSHLCYLHQLHHRENIFYGEASTPTASDPIAMMEFYMSCTRSELRPPKPSKDEMPPPAALQGEGLGTSKSGIAAPIMAGDVKKDNLGIGAHAPGKVTAEDDIYEQYKKQMMLGYRHRPNPLNNPRKLYY